MKIRLFLLALLFTGLVSCDKNDSVSITEKQLLLGSWVSPVYQDNLITYTRSSELKDYAYGFSFGPDGKFIERTISGWCATPPVVYDNNNGNWSLSGIDKVIIVKVANWQGEAIYKWKIIKITENELKLQLLSKNFNGQN